MNAGGLSTDQAPPLGVPTVFFATAPAFVAAAGGVLIWQGAAVLSSSWSPSTVALTHLLTLGVLAQVMLGALYQMTPVVAGSPVPAVRLAHGVHLALTVGTVALVTGLLWPMPALLPWAMLALGLAFAAFVLPVGAALARAPTRTETVYGLRLALLSLVLVAGLGLWMAGTYAGLGGPSARRLTLLGHLVAGVVGWVGGLIGAVSWQVVPMFYTARPHSAGVQRASLLVLGLAVPAAVVPLFFGVADVRWMGPLAALAGAVVWIVHPLTTLRSLAGRRRRRKDGSLRFWQTGMAVAMLCGPAAIAAWFQPLGPAPLLWGWLALWGWAAMVVHGMLYRIVPFLVWFHRLSPLLGRVPVPSMRALLPDARVQWAWRLHGLSVVLGALAIVLGSDPLARLTGVAVVGVATILAANLVKVLRTYPPSTKGNTSVG